MITSKKEYHYYLEADRLALGVLTSKFSIKRLVVNYFLPDYRLKYQQLMRKIEYRLNCKSGIINRIILFFLQVKYQKLGLKLLITIYPNTCGPGLNIAHHGPIHINMGAKIGTNCRIHTTNIGTKAGSSNEAAIIGNNVYIAPGVKFITSCTIADNIAIGANSVVTKSFLESGVTIAGIPAKVIKNGTDTRKMLIPATELMERGVFDTQGMTSGEIYEKYFSK